METGCGTASLARPLISCSSGLVFKDIRGRVFRSVYGCLANVDRRIPLYSSVRNVSGIRIRKKDMPGLIANFRHLFLEPGVEGLQEMVHQHFYVVSTLYQRR